MDWWTSCHWRSQDLLLLSKSPVVIGASRKTDWLEFRLLYPSFIPRSFLLPGLIDPTQTHPHTHTLTLSSTYHVSLWVNSHKESIGCCIAKKTIRNVRSIVGLAWVTNNKHTVTREKICIKFRCDICDSKWPWVSTVDVTVCAKGVHIGKQRVRRLKIPNICASLQQYYNHLVVAEGKREEERQDGVEEGSGEKGSEGEEGGEIERGR